MQQVDYPKIELYRVRSFTQKLTDTFDFLRENWRPMLKYFLYIMLPVSIILALPFNHFFEGYFNFISTIEKTGSFDDLNLWLFLASFVGSIVGFLLAALLLESLVFALVRVYDRRPDRLKDLFYADFRDDFFFCLKRGVIMVLVGLAMMIVIGIIAVAIFALFFLIAPKFGAVLSVLGIFILYIAIFVLIFPLYMVSPVYLLEDEIGVLAAYKKGLRLGFATWGGVFAVMFVIGIISSIFQSFTMIPWYFMSMAKMIFTLQSDWDKPFFHSFAYAFIQYLTCILMCLGYLLSMVISYVAITIQYGHASEKIDGRGVSHRIEKFDEFDNF